MPKFKFRLATLLRLREATRDQRRTHLAQAYQADEILRQQQEQLKQTLAKLSAGGRDMSGPGEIDIDRLLEAQRFELVLRTRQQQIRTQRDAVAGEINQRQEALVHANRRVRVLEKLREKQLRRYREEENRREIKQLDEVAGQRVRAEDVR